MKVLGSLIASAALTLSVLVAVPAPATAAPYPGTVATRCSYAVPGAVKRNRQLRVAYRVAARGNARPSGTVYFAVYKATRRGLKFVRLAANRYTGPRIQFRSLGKFKKGQYYTRMAFRPGSQNSVFKPCGTGLRGFRVKR